MFYKVISITNPRSKDDVKVMPVFDLTNTEDIVVKGGDFYAFWDERMGQWNTNRKLLFRRMNSDCYALAEKLTQEGKNVSLELASTVGTQPYRNFISYLTYVDMENVEFNKKIIFLSDEVQKSDYSTTRLSYDPKPGSTEAFDELLDKLYSKPEKDKILWFMGCLLSGENKRVEKFMYLYGGKGTGKGTVIKIFKKMCEGYFGNINLKKLTGNSEFSTSGIIDVPLLIDEDCDMSNLADDTNLLKMTSHEPVVVNVKYQKLYTTIFNGILITASNQPYKVRDTNSGILRRAISVYPTGKKIDRERYDQLMHEIEFELSAIAYKAIVHYKERGHSFYDNYEDLELAAETDYFLSFMRQYYVEIKKVMDAHDGFISLKQLCNIYKVYLEDNEYSTKGHKNLLKRRVNSMFDEFYTQKMVNGIKYHNVYAGLQKSAVFGNVIEEVPEVLGVDDIGTDFGWIQLKTQPSTFDDIYADAPAQLANDKGTPQVGWAVCNTKLKDIDTDKLHFVRVPENHIVIDFDLKDENGEKSLSRNLEAASKFPKTYAEISKSGGGLHLHYIYDGDIDKLASLYAADIEIKKFKGKSSIRRKLTLCTEFAITHIMTGLPLKKEMETIYKNTMEYTQNENMLRSTLKKCIRKEVHPNTYPNVSFIHKIMKEAEANGINYDLTDMKEDCYMFAALSTHRKEDCNKLLDDICWSTVVDMEEVAVKNVKDLNTKIYDKEDLWFFDCEVLPNMNLICYKKYGEDEVTAIINPTAADILELLERPLVGFYNREYDNHILYSILAGYSTYDTYRLSHNIIKHKKGKIGVAKNLTYADIYEYASAANKKSLKKFEIELGILHDEFEFDFDEPLPEEYWERCAEYCKNDVRATEAVFDAIYSDYEARCIMSEISGLPVNVKGNAHSSKIIFQGEPNHKDEFVYTDLSTIFPGYRFDERGIPKEEFTVPESALPKTTKSIYMGECPSEGGAVYTNPGIYGHAKTFDVVSMHPHSMKALNIFGKYTQRLVDLVDIRVLIKQGKLEEAGNKFGGKLKKYLKDPKLAKGLANALKTVINSVYGMTSAKFDNDFKDPRNVDNIVAKYGALFMITLKHKLMDLGYTIIHIKTDSIKVENPDDKVEQIIRDFGREYGFEFEVEDEWKRIAVINKAVLIGETVDGKWKAVGAQFDFPYVYKSLFSREPLELEDYMVTNQVQGHIYEGNLPDIRPGETQKAYKERIKEYNIKENMDFVGKFFYGYASKTGNDIIRLDSDTNRSGYVGGSKGFKWKHAKEISLQDIDMEFYHKKVREAVSALNKVGPSGAIIDIPHEDYYKDLITFY